MTKKPTPSLRKRKPTTPQSKNSRHPSRGGGEDVLPVVDEAALLTDLRKLIQSARQRIATVANATTTLLYWHLGRRLLAESLQDERAPYGKRILASVSRELTVEFGQAFTLRSLYRAIQFCQCFPGQEIVSTLSTQLSWSHFMELLPIKDPLARDFYAEMCRIERWSTRTLEKKINSMLYERTALSRKPAKLAEKELKALREEDRLTPDLVFRDPYLLDFLGLKDTYAEKDLEAAILREIEAFMLELGAGFCFVARQLRMQIDGRDYYLDLLFFHRPLRRLIAVDLKLGEFEAADKGQMELYLNWLKKHEQGAGEESPLGMILCAGKQQEHVELLETAASGIHGASYLTKLLPKKLLQRKLHEAVRLARARLAEGRKANA